MKYLYKNYDKYYSSIDVCVAKAKALGIKTPTTQTIYNWINLHLLKIKPINLLRSRGYWFKRAKSSNIWSTISKLEAIPITYRPTKIGSREEFGHYEIDLVLSSKASKKALLTFVERKTRIGFVTIVDNKTMDEINFKLRELIKGNNLQVKSITKDNGPEFNKLHEVTSELNIPLYACHPYSSCEKGSNENFNGLLRRKIPKKTNFKDLTQETVNTILEQINKMPRRILSYKTAQDSYEAEL